MYILLLAFLKGLAFGITMAAIPGPIFFLIIQRTLADGALTGLVCGLGAITADTAYALIAAIGLSFIMQFLTTYQTWITFAGGLFLLYLGITTSYRKPTYQSAVVQNNKLITAWFSTFLLTLTNPVTVISYCIIFAGLGIDTVHHNRGAIFCLVAGVITGAASVVIILVSFLSYFRQKLSTSTIRTINKGAGIILIVFGIIAILQSVMCF